ncbi:hypothetical protein EQG49_00090 [Periweissella cryptocerci]|uniref:Uncharacterized protein n=1 Tax=Periweissella cryptocerci TaxID=2506420 RepID=A0A4P6YQU2_9LACO|nr:hypothetical protein [Periweissella cryptocerci]QBO34953.1 hypothetical protein EQG49_00090 [Periweissella cryptocerci]
MNFDKQVDNKPLATNGQQIHEQLANSVQPMQKIKVPATTIRVKTSTRDTLQLLKTVIDSKTMLEIVDEAVTDWVLKNGYEEKVQQLRDLTQ